MGGDLVGSEELIARSQQSQVRGALSLRSRRTFTRDSGGIQTSVHSFVLSGPWVSALLDSLLTSDAASTEIGCFFAVVGVWGLLSNQGQRARRVAADCR